MNLPRSKAGLDRRIERRLNLTRGFRHLALILMAFLLCAGWGGVAVAGVAAQTDAPDSALVMAAAMPFCLTAGRLREASDGLGDGGGGGKSIEDQINDKLDEQRRMAKEIETKIAEIDKEGKGLSEKFATLVKNHDGLDSSVKEIIGAIAELKKKVRNEKKANFHTNPIKRIQSDEEMRMAVNGIVRCAIALQRGKSLSDMPKDYQKAWNELQEITGAEKKTITSSATPGSNFINDELIPELYSLVEDYGEWSGFDVIRAGTKTTKLLVRGADPTMQYVGEGVAPSEATFAGSQVSATVKKALAWVGVGTETVEDSEVDISSFVLEPFANAAGFRNDYACFQADGTDDADNGAFTGIFEGGTTVNAASGNTSVALLDSDDFVSCLTAVDPMVLKKPSAAWWMHPRQLARVLNIKDGNGRPIFLPAVDAPSFGGIGSILGYPVRLAHAAPSADGTSSKIATFGDAMGLAFLLRRDLELATSTEAKFTEDEIVFRARMRHAAKIRKATAFGVLTTAAS